MSKTSLYVMIHHLQHDMFIDEAVDIWIRFESFFLHFDFLRCSLRPFKTFTDNRVKPHSNANTNATISFLNSQQHCSNDDHM